MRKTVKYYHIIAALSVLTGCASVQEVEAPPQAQGSFEVYAQPVGTKTVNDGMSTLWVNGDTFSLFHAAAGSHTYAADGAFSVDNPETGHARGAVSSLSGTSHDWYLAYPASSSATSPASVPVTIGAAAGSSQTQSGADAMTHLAGPAVPLWGKASAVAAGTVPSLTVSPATSVLAVHVTNPGDAPVRVTEVRFKAPEAIVGSFTMDVTGSAPAFRATASATADEAVLSVSGNATLPVGGSALFYLVIKPFTARAGASLTLSVNDQERTVTLSKATTFAPGKIKTLNVTLDKSAPPVSSSYYFMRVTSVTPGRKYIVVAEDTKADNVLRMACPLPEESASGRLPAVDVTETDGVITLDGLENAFTFTESESGYTIRQADGRYLYNNGSSDNAYAGTEPNVGYYWTVTFDSDGFATIQNRTRRFRYNTTSSVRQFQFRETTSTAGVLPRLYELQNDEAAVDEFLQKTVPGVYDVAAEDWLYADGTHQMAVKVKDGRVTFRLFQPAEYVAIQLTGIPAGVSAGDRFTVRLSRFVKQVLSYSNEFTVTAAKVEGDTVWLMADGGSGFIVKIN